MRDGADGSRSLCLLEGPRPGDLGAIVALQARTYARSHGFGLAFETKIAREMAVFFSRYEGAMDLILTVRRESVVMGGLSLDATAEEDGELAHLRWVILAPEAQGRGFGRAMLSRAVERARSVGKAGIYLTTIADLTAAGGLYQSVGFIETHRETANSWGRPVTEVRMELRF